MYGREYLEALPAHEVQEMFWRSEAMLKHEYKRAAFWGALFTGTALATVIFALADGFWPYVAAGTAVISALLATEGWRVYPDLRYWQESVVLYRDRLAEIKRKDSTCPNPSPPTNA